MTQGFDELNKDDLGYNGFKDFKAGQQSRQAEIDALQKRIDDALKELSNVSNRHVSNARNILKGDKND